MRAKRRNINFRRIDLFLDKNGTSNFQICINASKFWLWGCGDEYVFYTSTENFVKN